VEKTQTLVPDILIFSTQMLKTKSLQRSKFKRIKIWRRIRTNKMSLNLVF
jgi:hypothetical protein